MPKVVALNADLGEEITDDSALLTLVTSANVACGFHAGTRATMQAVCAEGVRRGVALGAQVAGVAFELAGRVDSVCVHGDSPGGVVAAGAVRRSLEAAGVRVQACWSSTT